MVSHTDTLIRDALVYLKDPLTARKALLCTADEWEFFSAVQPQLPAPKVVEPVAKMRPLPQPYSHRSETSNFGDKISSPDGCVEREAIDVDRSIGKPTRTPSPVKTVEVEPQMSPKSAPVENHDFGEIKKMLQKVAPSLALHASVLDDENAKRVASAYKEALPEIEVVVLLCDEGQENLDFVKILAKAIDEHLGKAKVILASRLEREKRWDLFLQRNAFRLIIATSGIHAHKELMRFYKPPSQLNETPLVILAPSPQYQNQELKGKLWKTLCQMLKK